MAVDEMTQTDVAKSREEFIKSLDKDLKPEARQRQIELYDLQQEVNRINSTRSGVGTRLKAGMTRGKGSLVIQWEAFDESKPETLPKNLAEFASIAKIDPSSEAGKKTILDYLIVGYNDDMYVQASDPIAEFVNPAWDDDRKSQFRLVVRNLSKAMAGVVSLEDVAKDIRAKLDNVK